MIKRAIFAVSIMAVISCTRSPNIEVKDIRTYPVNDTTGLITQSGVEIDKEVSSDGQGSLKITSNGPAVIKLYETGDMDIENATLVYRAKIKSSGLQGRAFIEMYLSFKGQGEFFSRGLDTAITGSADWSTVEAPFFLNKGENPDNVKLNLVIEGKGTVWIDDIRLAQGPLRR